MSEMGKSHLRNGDVMVLCSKAGWKQQKAIKSRSPWLDCEGNEVY